VLPLVGLPLLAVLGLRLTARRFGKRPDTNFAVLFAVFTTGLSTMALQIALLFSFQSIYGFVYEMVGMIVAIFMGGLALGTLITHRYVADKANLRTLAGVQLLIVLVASLIAVVLPGVAAVPSPAFVFLLFSVLTFVAGLINGVDFPLAAACCLTLNRRAETSASTVYGIELFGACAGAVFASAVVAPILGIVACCLLASIANGTAFVVLLICRRSYA
jgi:spermidine synthase